MNGNPSSVVVIGLWSFSPLTSAFKGSSTVGKTPPYLIRIFPEPKFDETSSILRPFDLSPVSDVSTAPRLTLFSSKFNFFDASEVTLSDLYVSPRLRGSLVTPPIHFSRSRFESEETGKAESFNFGTIGCWFTDDVIGLFFRSRFAALEPHSSLDTLTIDSLGLPSMWSSSLESLISLHLTGSDTDDVVIDVDEMDPVFKLTSEVVILIFFTVPKPVLEAELKVVVDDSVVGVEHGRVGDRLDKGESALELERELSEESFEEVGLILSLFSPSMRKC